LVGAPEVGSLGGHHFLDRASTRLRILHAKSRILACGKILADGSARISTRLCGCCIKSNHLHLLLRVGVARRWGRPVASRPPPCRRSPPARLSCSRTACMRPREPAIPARRPRFVLSSFGSPPAKSFNFSHGFGAHTLVITTEPTKTTRLLPYGSEFSRRGPVPDSAQGPASKRSPFYRRLSWECKGLFAHFLAAVVLPGRRGLVFCRVSAAAGDHRTTV